MKTIQWPMWVDRRQQIGLDAVLRFGRESANAATGKPHARTLAFRDVARALGFQDRNSVGVLADLVEQINDQT